MSKLKHTCPQCSRETYRIVKAGVKDPGPIHCPSCEAKRRKAARDAFLQNAARSLGNTSAQGGTANGILSDFNDLKSTVDSNGRVLRALVGTLSDEQRDALEETIGDRLDRVLT